MLQAANTDLFNPLVPNAHNSDCQNRLSQFKANWRIFIFCTLGTNGLSEELGAPIGYTSSSFGCDKTIIANWLFNLDTLEGLQRHLAVCLLAQDLNDKRNDDLQTRG